MRILNIQRMSTEDGTGLRTTLFVKGCPLSCKWCHNPESIGYTPHIEWYKTRCIGCMTCVKLCTQKAISEGASGLKIDFNKCHTCLICVEECPAGALEVKGVDRSVKDLFDELIRDKAYWGTNGGITLSGGEVLSQSAEAAELLKMFKECGVHTAIDTSGFCSHADLDKVIPYTDLFLYDIKLIDSDSHKKWIGQDNAIILDNFNYLCQKAKGSEIWVRTPVIPGATDNEDNIKQIAKFINNKANKWELCAFNNLCRDKYERLDKDWEFISAGLMNKQKMETLIAAAKAEGADPVIWTGNTK